MSGPSSTNSMDTNNNIGSSLRAHDSCTAATTTTAASEARPGSPRDPLSTYASFSGASAAADSLLHAQMARAAANAIAAPAAAMPAPWPNPAAGSGTVLDDSPGPPAGCEPDAIKLFVGNIPKSCTELQLLPLFESVGHVVELAIMRDRDIQGSKGSAFLWYSTRAAAEMAIQKFHLRYILHDPVGENNRRLVLRRARARGDAAFSNTGPQSSGSGNGPAGGGAAQMLQLPPAPKPLSGGLGGQQAAVGGPGSLHLGQDKPPFIPLSYQSQGPHTAASYPWSRQLAPQPAADPGQPGPPPPIRTGSGRRNANAATSSPLPSSPNLSMVGLLSPSTALLNQHALSTVASGRPTPSAYPASLSGTTTQVRGGGGGGGYGDRGGDGDRTYGSMSLSQLSHQLDQLDVVQRGAGVHRPYSMDSVVGLPSLGGGVQMGDLHAQQQQGGGGGGGGSNLPGSPGSSAPPPPPPGVVATTLLLDSAQLHNMMDYLHSVQAMCGAEVLVSMPPVPGCFQLKISGSQTQVQSGKILIDSLLGITYP